MSICCQNSLSVFTKAKTLDSNAFPRVDYVAVQVLTFQYILFFNIKPNFKLEYNLWKTNTLIKLSSCAARHEFFSVFMPRACR